MDIEQKNKIIETLEAVDLSVVMSKANTDVINKVADWGYVETIDIGIDHDSIKLEDGIATASGFIEIRFQDCGKQMIDDLRFYLNHGKYWEVIKIFQKCKI